MAVTEALRALIDQIILTPDNGALQIDVRGDLAGILNISLERKKPAKKAGSLRAGTPSSHSASIITFMTERSHRLGEKRALPIGNLRRSRFKPQRPRIDPPLWIN